jgi:hypothetical protein
MTTQYTTILKLALPVQGELSGSWGDVVNDNITEMVEEAVAGLATINSWTANSHTLTTANGTTSESRCAVLVADDDGAGNPSAAATIICPSATKLYVLKNISGQQVTLKTAAGTGVAVPNGSAAFLFCDGTNVEACQTDIIDATTIDTTNLEVTNIKAKDGTASGSIANSTGVFTINSAVLTTADINGGTIDGAVIGGSSAAAGTFTTFTSTGIDDNASSTAITIDSSQNVGIGTASPAHELDVLGASDPIIRVRATGSGTSDDSLIRMAVTNASASNYIQFGDTSDADVGYIRYAHSTNSLYFATNAAVGMTIDSSQNVGIGTASPASALTVSDGTVSSLTPFGGTELFLDSIGSNYLQFGSGTSSSPAIYFGDSADGDVGGIIYAHASNAMSFRTNGSESMRIDTSGKLIVNGTTGMGMLNAYASNWPENALAIYSANVAGQTNYAGIAFNNQDTDAAVGNVADIYTNPTGTLSLTSGANPAIQL